MDTKNPWPKPPSLMEKIVWHLVALFVILISIYGGG